MVREVKQVVKGTVEFYEIFNGYALYGQGINGDDLFLGHLGDQYPWWVVEMDEDEVAEAYNFELVEEQQNER